MPRLRLLSGKRSLAMPNHWMSSLESTTKKAKRAIHHHKRTEKEKSWILPGRIVKFFSQMR